MKYTSNRGRAEEYVEKQITKKMLDVARDYERLLDSQFTEPKTGRMYGKHRASAPGEAPGILSAHLRKGVIHAIDLFDRMMPRLRIGESIESGRGAPTGVSGRSIAVMLEFGTVNMEPRPAWRVAMQKLKEMFA